MPTVQELFIYPLKSARAIPRSSVLLTETGFEWDRHWMAVDARGSHLTQRTHPRLALVEPQMTADALVLSAPDLSPLRLPLEPAGEAIPVQVWNDRCTGLDQGDVAAEWISEVLHDSARLVRMPPSMGRMADPKYAGPIAAPVSYTDGYPILVCNRASLDALNARMPEPVPMERFRPNVVVEGLPPFAEDRIACLRVGPIVLRLVKPSTRCVITSTDQRTGERTTNPLPVLREFRFDRKLRGMTFGENAVIAAGQGAYLERGADCSVDYEDGVDE